MCGLAGIVGPSPDPASVPERLRRMCSSIERRGPDGHGVSVQPLCALGHRRLSIIDVAGGAQPMTSRGGDVVVVYNGEIYNYEALRRELEADGFQFSTQSDTEVLLNAYLKHGKQCARVLRGMFAFAIWDARDRSLLLCRDRLGKKPLYYARAGAALVFGSEIKALLASGLVGTALDAQALDDYFAYGFIRSPRSIYQGVRSLLPGQSLTVRVGDGGVELDFESYFELPRGPAGEPTLSYPEAQAELGRRFEEAVRLRLCSEVPLGALLSGGIDSSSVVWAMSRAQTRRVQTFCIGFEEQSHDEAPFARAVAQHLGTDHHEEIVRPDAVAVLPEIVRQFDEPFGDPSAIPTWYVSKMARRHVTVCLSGDGGDELFAGYTRYATVERELGARRPLARWLLGAAAALAPRESRLTNRYERLRAPDFNAYYARFRNNYSPDMRAELFAPELAARVSLAHTQDLFQRRSAAPGAGVVAQAQLADLQGYLSDDILVKLDRMSMAHSLEARAPLLDQELVTFVQSLPTGYKRRGGRAKSLLLDLVEPHLPSGILARPKRGFSVPLARWFRGELKERLRAALHGPTFAPGGMFATGYVQRLYRLHTERRVDLSFQLWQLLVFDEWWRSRGDGA